MARPSGSKVVGPCPYCGKRYRLTNFMRRNDAPIAADGTRLWNTHLIACERNTGNKAQSSTRPSGQHD